MGESNARGTGVPMDLLWTVLGASSDAACVASLDDGTILWVNDSFLAVTARSRQDLVGRSGSETEVWPAGTFDGSMPDGIVLISPDGPLRVVTSCYEVTVDSRPCALFLAMTGSRSVVDEEVLRRDAILRAGSYVSARFLRSPSWVKVIDEVLEALGGATGADRVYVFENESDRQGRLCMSIRAEWDSITDEGEPAPGLTEVSNKLYPYEDGFSRWEAELGAGAVIAGRTEAFPESERPMLLGGHVISLALVPVFVGERWWGFIGFDDTILGSDWTRGEIEALRLAAEALGAAIEREETAELLADTEKTHRNLVEGLPGVVYLESLEEGNPDLYISPQYEALFGESPETRLKEPLGWAATIHPDDRDEVIEATALANVSLEPTVLEYRIVRPDGGIRWVRDEGVVALGRDDRPLYWVGLIADVSAEKEAEARLAAADAKFRVLVEQVPAATYVETPVGEKDDFYISPRIQDITGYPAEAFKDPDFWGSKIHPEDREWVLAEDERTDATGEAFSAEYRYVRADGETIWLREDSQPVLRDGRGSLTIGLIADITERKRAETEILRAEVILQSVSYAGERFLRADDWREVIDDVLGSLGGASGASRAYLFEFRDEDGVRTGNLTYEWCREGTTATIDDPANQGYRWDDASPEFRSAMEGDRDFQRLTRDVAGAEREYLEGDGILSFMGMPVYVGGRLWGNLGFDDCFTERAWSITEVGALRTAASMLGAAAARRAIEIKLREAESSQRTLVERVPAVIYRSELGGDGPVTYVSPQYETMFGFTTEQLLADPRLWTRLVHPDDLQMVIDASKIADRTGTPFSMEYRMYRRDGSQLWVSDEAVIVRDDEGVPRFWLGILLDISGRKEAEEELGRHDAILEAVGFAATQFLHAESWEECIDDVLRHLGRSGDASRAYVFRNSLGQDGRLRTSITHEWVAEGVSAQISNPLLRDALVSPPKLVAGDQPPWAKALAGGGIFQCHVKDMSPQEREIYEPQDIKSILEVPLFVGGEWWGFLGFDECRVERTWSLAEVEALRAATGVFGAVVERGEAEVHLREAEEQNRLLIEQLPVVVYLDAIDSESANLYMSPQLDEMLGFPAEERMETSRLWADLLLPEDRAAVLAESARTDETGDDFVMDYRMVARDGRIVWVHDESVLVRDEKGGPLHWQGVLFDITDRKEAEAELKRTLQLEREVAERLRSLDEMKNTFLTAVSHDLRTPLAAVLGLALTLEREDIGLEANEARDLAHRIATNARKLNRLVTDLLDLDRLSRGIFEPNLSLTDLGLLVRKVVSEADYLSEYPVAVEAESIEISVDTAKVERIVENLLANSVRHTPVGTRIWVKVRSEGDGALLLIEDDGPGVLAELREAVFEPFRQGTTGGPSPGVGIGLSLVARFAELHGGRAWVAEREGGGASFRVYLPGA